MVVLGVVKGESATQGNHKHDTRSPDISAAGIVGLICAILAIVQQLWGHVLWRAAAASVVLFIGTRSL